MNLTRLPARFSLVFLSILICLMFTLSPPANAQTTPTPQLQPTLAQTTGIFWNPAESGWGCNSIAQENPQSAAVVQNAGQRKFILFITCFVYDKDGKPVWLVAPDARDTGNGKYLSRAYRTTSAGFGAMNFNPSSVGVFDVGTIEIDFGRVFDKSITFTIRDVTNVVQFNG